jgi:hypothetical protein
MRTKLVLRDEFEPEAKVERSNWQFCQKNKRVAAFCVLVHGGLKKKRKMEGS